MATASAASKSTGSESPATGLYEAHQMEVDSRTSPMREAQLPSQSAVASSSSFDGRASMAGADYLDKQLISSTSRLSRLPPKVPSTPQTNPSHPDPVAISAHQTSTTSYTSQDVHLFVNNSASSTPSLATRTFGHSTPPETSVSSFSQPLQHHVLTHPIRRPRTSTTVFQSSTDLAAHYGIPQILPPAPRTTPRFTPAPAPKDSSAIADFQTLSSNYLNMLNNKSTDTSVAASSAPAMSTTVAPMGLDAPDPITQTQLQDLADFIGKSTALLYGFSVTHLAGSYLAASPAFRDQDYFDNYMTSPLVPELDDFGTSPLETPYSDFLTTPLFSDDAMLTSPNVDYSDMPLFPEAQEQEYTFNVEQEVPVKSKSTTTPAFDIANLYTISPTSPALDSFDTSFEPSDSYTHDNGNVSAYLLASKSNAASRRAKATGIRKGITPDNLLDESAPTQPRKYTTPSATSRKELPAVFARKRSRSTAFGDEEEDQLDSLPPNPTEKDLIEQKRRQNTVAARRSRKRKLEQFQMMEHSRNEERKLKELWKERADCLLKLVRNMGMAHPDFPPDESLYGDV